MEITNKIVEKHGLNQEEYENIKAEIEELKMRNFRNNLIIGVLGIVIFALLVF